MPILWSRIHAELGRTPCPLTYEMFESAVAHRVREAADLDWKGALISADEAASGPGRQKAIEDRRKEFAKDVAAMANTQGGLIVYGVRDVNEEADSIAAVPLDERERQRLRSWVNGLVRPWLPDLLIEEFTEEGDRSEGILVVSVPASPDSPHIVGERNEVGVPYRDGAHTGWMSEHQLERAYRDRFARQASDDIALDEQLVEIRDQLDLESGGAWILVAARPSTALAQLTAQRPDRASVKETLAQALVMTEQIQPAQMGRYLLLRELGDHAANNPRVGLRRWVATDSTLGPADALSKHVHVELHHDAASTVAFGIERWIRPGNNEPYHRVAVPYVGSAILDSIALATSHARSCGFTGELLVKAELVRGDARPFGAVDQRNIRGLVTGNLTLVDQSRLVHRPKRVQVGISTDSDPERLRQAAHQLDSDLIHQFGIARGSVPDS